MKYHWKCCKISLRFVTGDYTLRNVTSPLSTFTWAGQSLLGPKNQTKLTCMVGRMGGGLHFLVEIELEMAKMPAKW